MISINTPLDCCGCSACVEICPQSCIEFQTDIEGFWYPVVNTDSCIKCDLCEKVCPVINEDENKTPIKVYAAINKNEKIRKESASGGIFTVVAEKVINEGGVVFGVKFDEQWDVIFDYTENIDGLQAFRKSKYVQAWVGNSFVRVKEFLNKGRLVLFTGTPCQISGLRHFLRKDYGNLLLMDLICEGVPSPKVWKKYLNEEFSVQAKKNTVLHHPISGNDVLIKDISFRNKDEGWKKFSFALTLAKATADGEKNSVLPTYVNRESAYMRAMFACLDLRPICYSCPFKSCKSHSDLTIADYWGIDVLHPEMDDDMGTSMIHVHTDKGAKYLDTCQLNYIETTYEEAFKYNNIITSTPLNPKRKKFFSQIDKRKSIINLMYELSIPHYYIRLYSKKILGKKIVGIIRRIKELI